jgi:hypothetical protein
MKSIQEMNRSKMELLMEMDNTATGDIYRKSLFYIISSVEELWDNKLSIYDFSEHMIKPEILDSQLCSSSKKLISVAFNMYNENNPTKSLIECFLGLDETNVQIVLDAIKLRLEI